MKTMLAVLLALLVLVPMAYAVPDSVRVTLDQTTITVDTYTPSRTKIYGPASECPYTFDSWGLQAAPSSSGPWNWLPGCIDGGYPVCYCANEAGHKICARGACVNGFPQEDFTISCAPSHYTNVPQFCSVGTWYVRVVVTLGETTLISNVVTVTVNP